MSSSGKFSFWVAVSFTINYVIGSGFLTLPWAFGEAGLLLSCSVMLIFGLFSIISVLFILETTERIRVIQSSQRNVNLFHLASNGYQHVLTSEKQRQTI
jgi:amino acid permease